MIGLRTAVILGVGGVAVSLLLARVHPFGDARLYAQKPAPPRIMEDASVSPMVRKILITKCADCHSTQTRSPIYGRLAPASWLMERDIIQARDAMNLDQWDKYSAEEQEMFRIRIMLDAKAHKMPPLQYRVVHWNAKITDADVHALTEWVLRTSSHASQPAEQVLEEGDAMRGKVVFEKRCTGCHAMDQNLEGPRLRDVFGSTSGAVKGFAYSSELQKAHIVWNEQTLEQWLADPDALVPGNNMEFSVAKPQERRDLIRFLRESAGR